MADEQEYKRHLMPGEKVSEFKVERMLGAGAMGHVYLVSRAGEQYVMKMPSEDGRVEELFKNEVKAVKELSDIPNSLRYISNGEHNGVPYLVMEHVNGETLDKKYDTSNHLNAKPIENEDVIRVAYSVLDTLEEMHKKGIAHQDIKPSNIMETYDEKVKLIDFGLAGKPSDFIGTVAYASPEQIGLRQGIQEEYQPDEELTVSSDLYGLGATLYKLVTGSAPAVDGLNNEDMQTLKRVDPKKAQKYRTFQTMIAKCSEKNYNSRLRDPTDFEKEVPDKLASILMKALQFRVNDRYKDADEMRTDFEGFEGLQRLNTYFENISKVKPKETYSERKARLEESYDSFDESDSDSSIYDLSERVVVKDRLNALDDFLNDN